MLSTILALTAALALAGAETDARSTEALIEEANQLRQQQRDDLALELLRRAHQQSSSPKAAAQLALCEQGLSLWIDAQTHLELALRATGDPWIRKYRRTLQTSLDAVRAHIGSIAVLGKPVGAVVTAAGRKVGTVPLQAADVQEGSIEIVVEAEGHQPWRERVLVVAKRRSTVTVDLHLVPRTPTVPASAPLTNEPPVAHSTSPLSATADLSQPAEPEAKPRSYVLPITLGVAGVVVGAVGYLLFAQGGSKRESIERAAEDGTPYEEGDGNWQTLDRSGLGMMAAGTLLVASGGLTLLIW